MKIGLIDVDGHNFPNLALMKISSWHKSRGDTVEFAFPMYHYDKIYVSKIFGDEYSKKKPLYIQADEVVYGGTGFAITVENGKEVYHKCNDNSLPPEIEHVYPDYSLYPTLTENTAYGFLTRGCPNNCGFCIVSKKEGLQSVKVADLSEFWNGQKLIKLLDANLLACKDRKALLQQLIDSRAKVDFTQGLDAAIAWCKEQGITFDYINENAPERVGTYGGDSRKISADVYIDDKAATPVLLGYNAGIVKGIWRIVAELLEQLALLDPYPATAVLKEKARMAGERKEGAGDV